MKLKYITLLCLGLLCGCSVLGFATTINKFDESNNQKIEEHYSIHIIPDNTSGFFLAVVGVIIPIIPIPMYITCGGKTSIYLSIYTKDRGKTSNSVHNINQFVKASGTFDNSSFNEIIKINIETLLDASKFPDRDKSHDFMRGVISFPIPCNKWNEAKIIIDDIYIDNIKQSPIEFKLKKQFVYGFGFMGA